MFRKGRLASTAERLYMKRVAILSWLDILLGGYRVAINTVVEDEVVEDLLDDEQDRT